MKELLIQAMEENRKNIIERLKNESGNLSGYEIDQLLDSLLEIDILLKNIRNEKQ